MINVSCIHCVHTTFNLISKLIVMARKTDYAYYEKIFSIQNNMRPKNPQEKTSEFQAIIIHYKKGNHHDFKD